MVKILFVCLGNICRSPLAEGIFKHKIEQKNLEDQFLIDSCGTSAYHVGNPADSRMRETAFRYGVLLTSKARQLKPADLNEFDYIIAMDNQNLTDILRYKNKHSKSTIHLMREYDLNSPKNDVPDPYYGGITGFENVFNIVNHCCENFLNKITNDLD